jgi:hypothetical protein
MLAKGDLNSGWRAKSCAAVGFWSVCATIVQDKRTNWLLIKHRDKYAKDGNGEAILEKDHSVASGRAMESH